ncbi:MAG: TMEM175 family protein [Bacteroidota bacterium]
MTSNRLEAFSDGVLAIIITIMVLELKVPQGFELAALKPLIPKFISYLLSFIYIGIYWNNHHHLFHAIKKIDGKVLWANLFLLFVLSLIPFTTAWMGENDFQKNTVMVYGFNLLLCAFGFNLLEKASIKNEGEDSVLGKALGNRKKEYTSIFLYVFGIGVAYFSPVVSLACFVVVALIWIIPDKRIERKLKE